MRRIAFALLCCACLFAVSAAAQPADPYPTRTALDETIPPPLDEVQMARDYRGLRDLPPPPTSAPALHVGDQAVFKASNTSEEVEYEVQATLRVIGDHIYLWVQDGLALDEDSLRRLAQGFDQRIYEPVRALWGEEANPGIDGDPRVHGLFASGLGNNVAAYFSSRNSQPRAVQPGSNEREMFYFNADALNGDDVDTPYIESVIAHEFQHMIRYNIQPNEALWLNEGLSTYTELRLFGTQGFAYSFFGNPQTQLNSWNEDGSRAPNYGAALLFVDYFTERYGDDALRALSADPHIGLAAFDHTLRQRGQDGVDSLFADWVLANALLDPTLDDGRYGYRALRDLSSPPPRQVWTDYPALEQAQSNQYATDYYVLNNLGTRRKLTLSLTAPQEVAVIPTQPPSGAWMWYSNRADRSRTTLTRAFDLTGLNSATLTYKVWYDLEDFWDYGYVAVSADEGATWTPLATPSMDATDPLNSAVGPGYTGVSVNWLDERLSLDAYAGQRVLVRFDVVADDAVTQPGLALDDVAVPELGYASDFEADGGGWEAAGWVRMDNRLPQQVWVQAVERIGTDVRVTRWLATGTALHTLQLDPNTDQVLLAVSPFAPLTTVYIPYTLKVALD